MTTPSPDKLEIPDAAVELLPCPFCGAPGNVAERDHGMWMADCSADCPAAASGWAPSRVEAIAAWNRRAPHMPDRGYAEVAPTHRHKKRGSEYVLLSFGKMQAEKWRSHPSFDASVDMREVAIYRSIDDGGWWVRPREEFEDGRFEALPASALIVPQATVSRGYAEGIEAAAKTCEDQSATFLSEEYCSVQPMGSFSERFACKQCAAAIRALAPPAPAETNDTASEASK